MKKPKKGTAAAISAALTSLIERHKAGETVYAEMAARIQERADKGILYQDETMNEQLFPYDGEPDPEPEDDLE